MKSTGITYEDYLSRKIRIISFLATLAVIWQHIGGGYAKNLVVNFLCFWAVPWFLMVSGVFFMKTYEKYPFLVFSKKKAHSLVVPYLFWGALGGCICMPQIQNMGVHRFLDYFGITSLTPEGNTPLWYIQSIVIYMFIMWGAIYVSCGRVGIAFVVFSAVCGIMIAFKFKIGMPASPYWFLLGCLTTSCSTLKRCRLSSRSNVLICIAMFCAAVVLRIIWMKIGGAFAPNRVLELAIRNVANAATIVLIWSLIDLVAPNGYLRVYSFMTTSFVVYCAHMPLIRCINHVLKGLECDYYFIEAIIFPLVLFLLASGLKRSCPKLYGFLSGGR